tara:strand:- start:541 stop:1134 length:594 start_codon:yes stop_codon:yes gene_type:complete
VYLYFLILLTYLNQMNHKTLIIYQNKILFNILNELFSNNFEFIFFEKKDFSFKDIEDYLIIVDNNNCQFENQLIIKKFPFKIKDILEQINITFLKKNFKIQSEIKIGSYVLNLNSREINFGKKKIFLTERESNLIIFLHKSSTPINISELQKQVWGYSSLLDTHTVETHIYRLRKKMKDTFEDENFIISTQNGYFIN